MSERIFPVKPHPVYIRHRDLSVVEQLLPKHHWTKSKWCALVRVDYDKVYVSGKLKLKGAQACNAVFQPRTETGSESFAAITVVIFLN